jgi:hypothetical protein
MPYGSLSRPRQAADVFRETPGNEVKMPRGRSRAAAGHVRKPEQFERFLRPIQILMIPFTAAQLQSFIGMTGLI